MSEYVTQFPELDDTHIVALTNYSTLFRGWKSFDPRMPITGNWNYYCYVSMTNYSTDQRLHIDMGRPKEITRLKFENAQLSGSYTSRGVNNYYFYASNSSTDFETLTTGAPGGTWTKLTSGVMIQHSTTDGIEWQYITLTPTTPYQYYCFFMENNFGATANQVVFRRLELQSNTNEIYPIISAIGGSTYYPLIGSVQYENAIGERGTCSFQLYDEDGSYDFGIGENIEIYSPSGLLEWSGVISRITKKCLTSTGVHYQITGVTWNYALDKRRVIGTWTTDVTSPLYASTVVNDIITQYLSQENITAGTISSGASLGKVVFNYIKPSNCLDVLSQQSGYVWQVNPNKTLDFFPITAATICMSIGATQMKDPVFNKQNPKYRNTQYVVGGMELTAQCTEYQYGDGAAQAFTMPFPIMLAPSVYHISGTTTDTKTVGILGVDSSYQFFWQKYSNVVTQNATDTAIASAERIKVKYYGGYPTVATAQDSTAISSLAAYEGGSGVVEDVILKGKETLIAENQLVANEMVSKYATDTDTLTFKTMENHVFPGKFLTIDFPDFGISTDMLVDRVSVRDEGRYVWYEVSCLAGPEPGGWAKFYEDFVQKTVERDIWAGSVSGDIVIASTSFSETIGWGSTFAIEVGSCLSPCSAAGTLYPRTTNYPC